MFIEKRECLVSGVTCVMPVMSCSNEKAAVLCIFWAYKERLICMQWRFCDFPSDFKVFNFNFFTIPQRKCTCQRKKKRCYCFRPNRNENWLFSRYSTGWKCGLHADWTELTGCVDQELDKNEGETAKRRYFYITLLRSPIPRYLSEFRHVQRGATWKNARHFCLGRQATAEELPACYAGKKL